MRYLETVVGFSGATNYKIDKNEKVVGFIAEDVPELVAVNGRNGLSPMDLVAVLTKVVQVQEKRLHQKEVEIANVENKLKKLERMEVRLSEMEEIMKSLQDKKKR